MRWYTILANVDALGVYQVEAESEDEARDKFEQWIGDDDVSFSHYSEEIIGEIVSVEEDI
jgi:hypothetical protein